MINEYEYEYDDDDVELSDQNIPLTDFEKKCSCCGLYLSYIPAIQKYFLNTWEIGIAMPLVVLFIILSSYSIFYKNYCKTHLFSVWFFCLITVVMILYIFSYLSTIYEGPGYLPFYYPIKYENNQNQKHNHNQRDEPDYGLNGIVVTDEQRIYAKSQTLDKRIHFFKLARRFVIRPDHYCGWVHSFIGIKNHKLFFHFNLWGTVYIFLFLYSSMRYILTYFTQNQKWSIITLIYMVFGFSFCLSQLIFMIDICHGFFQNQTQWEKMKIRSFAPSHYSCDGWIEVCGPLHKFYSWLIPISPYHGIDPYLIVKQNEMIL